MEVTRHVQPPAPAERLAIPRRRRMPGDISASIMDRCPWKRASDSLLPECRPNQLDRLVAVAEPGENRDDGEPIEIDALSQPCRDAAEDRSLFHIGVEIA